MGWGFVGLQNLVDPNKISQFLKKMCVCVFYRSEENLFLPENRDFLGTPTTPLQPT